LFAGGLTSFLIYTLNIGVAFSTLTSLFADFMKAVGATQRVFELIEREPDVRAKGGLHLYEVLGNVKVDNISFSYPSRADVTVLKDVSLELEPGKVVALVSIQKYTRGNISLNFNYYNWILIVFDSRI
jgi:ABC-type multidrug transport system fused ATPase/permease subunit